MNKEQFHSELNNSLLSNFASEAISNIRKKILPELEEKRSSNPLLGAINNFKFIKNIISPVLSDLCRYGINLNEDSKVSFKVKFDSFVDNSDSQAKFIAYNGIDLCISRGDGKDGIAPLRTIMKENDLRKLYSSKGGREAREAISAFGRLSKKDVASEIIKAIGLILPSESLAQEISVPVPINFPIPDADSSDYTDPFNVIKKLFTRKKAEKSPETSVDKDRLLRVK